MVQVQAILLPIQLPELTPDKPAADGPSAWALTFTWETHREFQVLTCLTHPPTLGPFAE